MHILHKMIAGILILTMAVSGGWMLSEGKRILKNQHRYEQLAREAKMANRAGEAETAEEEGEGRADEAQLAREARLANRADEAEAAEKTRMANETDEEKAAGEREEENREIIDFQMLKTQNPDTVAWLHIPETNIDYPIVQAEDNETYLHRNFFGEESRKGAIFLDFETPETLDGRNNVIYGHHMKDGTMFRDIARFKDPEYFKSHRNFQIYTPDRTICLKAVSCYFQKSTPDIRRCRFEDGNSFQIFVKQMLEPCTFAEIPEEPVECLYTFVTCSYEAEDARTVLFAVEIAK